MDGKVQLLLENYNELRKIRVRNPIKQCIALSLAMEDIRIEEKRIKDAIHIVKSNTLMFSTFRGKVLLAVATTIAKEENMKDAFFEINRIYEALNNKFFPSKYLVAASIIIFNARHRIDVNTAINNTYIIYKNIHESHIFLSEREHIIAAATIAVIPKNIEDSMKEIDEGYKFLMRNKILANKDIQALSHMMVLFDGTTKEKVNRIKKVKKALNRRLIFLGGNNTQLLSVASVCMNISEEFVNDFSKVDSKLRKKKGFRRFYINSEKRKTLACGIVCSSYANRINEIKEEMSINEALSIKLAMEIQILKVAIKDKEPPVKMGKRYKAFLCYSE